MTDAVLGFVVGILFCYLAWTQDPPFSGGAPA